jgi:hypothetical protein
MGISGHDLYEVYNEGSGNLWIKSSEMVAFSL